MKAMDEEQLCVLDEFNAEEVSRLTPVIIYLCTVCVLGIIGNSVSLYIYARHYEDSNARSFCIYLTSTELFSSIIVMPVEIFMLFRNYVMFENELCQSISFLNVVQIELSTSVLLLIAVDRYRKVCHPFSWQVTQRAANIVCVLFCFWACIVAAPCIHLYNIRTSTQTFNEPFETDCFRSAERLLYNITVYECTAKTDGDNRTVRTAYSIYWLCLSVLITTALALIYWRILVQIRRQNVKLSLMSTRRRTLAASRTSEIEAAKTSEMKSDDIIKRNVPSTLEKHITDSEGWNNASCITDDGTGGNKNDQRPHNSADCDTSEKCSQRELGRTSDTIKEQALEGIAIQNKPGGIRISVSHYEEPGTLTNRIEHTFQENGKHEKSSSEKITTVYIDPTTESEDKAALVNTIEHLEEFTGVKNGNTKATLCAFNPSCFENIEQSTFYENTSNNHSAKQNADPSAMLPVQNKNAEHDSDYTNAVNKAINLTELVKIGSQTEEIVTLASIPSKGDIQIRSRTRKVTLTMFIITLSTIVCFTPYFVRELSKSSSPHLIESASESQRVVFAYCTRSYYLKSVINPLIYGIFDSRFNAALRKILSRVRCKS